MLYRPNREESEQRVMASAALKIVMAEAKQAIKALREQEK
jgi:hypothetical protein